MAERITQACVEIVDYLFAADQFIVENRGTIKNESVDKWSVAYDIPNYLSPNDPEASMTIICQKRLTRPKNLMYRGR